MRHAKNCVVHNDLDVFPQVIAMPERSLKVWIASTEPAKHRPYRRLLSPRLVDDTATGSVAANELRDPRMNFDGDDLRRPRSVSCHRVTN